MPKLLPTIEVKRLKILPLNLRYFWRKCLQNAAEQTEPNIKTNTRRGYLNLTSCVFHVPYALK